MLERGIFLIFISIFSFSNGVDRLNLEYLLDSNESLVDESPLKSFRSVGDEYILEKKIPQNAEVQTLLEDSYLKIIIIVTKTKRVVIKRGVGESSIKSTTIEEIPIPSDANTSLLKKELNGEVLKVKIPKSKTS